MTYSNREHLHNKDVRPRLNTLNYQRLIAAAEHHGLQPAVMARLFIELCLDTVERHPGADLFTLIEDQGGEILQRLMNTQSPKKRA